MAALPLGVFEQEFDVTPEMVDAVGCDRRSTLGFGKDKGALQNGLSVECEALCAPLGVRRFKKLKRQSGERAKTLSVVLSSTERSCASLLASAAWDAFASVMSRITAP